MMNTAELHSVMVKRQTRDTRNAKRRSRYAEKREATLKRAEIAAGVGEALENLESRCAEASVEGKGFLPLVSGSEGWDLLEGGRFSYHSPKYFTEICEEVAEILVSRDIPHEHRRWSRNPGLVRYDMWGLCVIWDMEDEE